MSRGATDAGTAGRVIRGTAAYSAAMILQRAASLLLLPFFANVLTPTEFGQIGVIMTVATALGVVVSLGLETAIFRGYSRIRAEGGSSVSFINTLLGFVILVPLGAAIVFTLLFIPWLAEVFAIPADALSLAGFGAALTASATLGPLTILRAQERLSGYLQLTAVQVLVVPVLTIVFVLIADLGVTGWMLAYGLGAATLLVRGLLILGHRWTADVNFASLRLALTFGLPLVPHALSHWALSVSDRAILGGLVGASVVGSYYVAYLLCLPISLAAIAVAQASQPIFAEAIDSPSRHQELNRIMTVHAAGTMLIGAAVVLVGPAILALAFPPEYGEASRYIPWLAVGTALFGLYLMPMNAVTVLAGRTGRVWIITVLAATANVVLNVALIPEFGAMAAAVNTTIGYGALFGGVWLYMQRICNPPVGYHVIPLLISSAVVVIPTAVMAALTSDDSIGSLALRACTLVAISLALIAWPLRAEAQATWSALSPQWRRFRT